VSKHNHLFGEAFTLPQKRARIIGEDPYSILRKARTFVWGSSLNLNLGKDSFSTNKFNF
jgi:hypothetical protein